MAGNRPVSKVISVEVESSSEKKLIVDIVDNALFLFLRFY